MDEITALDVLERQNALEHEARRRYPWDPANCTHHMDIPQRQVLWACMSCSPPRNCICYACSLRCHAGHNLVELWSKRGMTCDCGTTRIGNQPCKLRGTEGPECSDNTDVQYNQNFDGLFCDCHEQCTDSTSGIMFQCLLGASCGEDWFHARCIMGMSRDEEQLRADRAAVVKSEVKSEDDLESSDGGETYENDILRAYNEDSDAEDFSELYSGMPPKFSAFVCHHCVESLGLERLPSGPWKFVYNNFTGSTQNCSSGKRHHDIPSLFLLDGFRDQFSSLSQNSNEYAQLLRRFPVLKEPEQTYEPPLDEEEEASLYEAGSRALAALPYSTAATGVEAYSLLRDQLSQFLAPFAASDQVVTAKDVQSFFANCDKDR